MKAYLRLLACQMVPGTSLKTICKSLLADQKIDYYFCHTFVRGVLDQTLLENKCLWWTIKSCHIYFKQIEMKIWGCHFRHAKWGNKMKIINFCIGNDRTRSAETATQKVAIAICLKIAASKTVSKIFILFHFNFLTYFSWLQAKLSQMLSLSRPPT